MSWLGAFAVAAPHWMKGEALPKMSDLMMFPVMLLGPSISGMVMTGTTRGKDGLRDLLARNIRPLVDSATPGHDGIAPPISSLLAMRY
jgi:hypothetical protein